MMATNEKLSRLRKPGQPKIETHEVTLPRRGRQEPIKAELLGTVVQTTTGREDVRVDDFRGQPIDPLLAFASERGFDPAVCLAAGINAMIARHARGEDKPALADVLVQKGLASNPDEARLVAMHSQTLARRMKISPEDLISALELLKSA